MIQESTIVLLPRAEGNGKEGTEEMHEGRVQH